MVRLHDVATSDVVHPLLAEAAAKAASSLIRRSATIGGNLCLDTRCFWYNQSEDWRRSIEWCHKADCGTGADCRVIPNQNTLCVATYQGDMAAAFMALGAEVELVGPSGERRMPLEDFFELDGMKKNVLQPGEFLLAVHLSPMMLHRGLAPTTSCACVKRGLPRSRHRSRLDSWRCDPLRVASTGLESIQGCTLTSLRRMPIGPTPRAGSAFQGPPEGHQAGQQHRASTPLSPLHGERPCLPRAARHLQGD